METTPVIKVFSKALMLSTVQFGIVSIQLPNRFEEKHDLTDSLNKKAIKSLEIYIDIAIFWTLTCCLFLYSLYGKVGLISALVSNALAMMLVFFLFRKAHDKNS